MKKLYVFTLGKPYLYVSDRCITINKETDDSYYIKNESFIDAPLLRSGVKELVIKKSDVIGFTYETTLRNRGEKRREYSETLIKLQTEYFAKHIKEDGILIPYMFSISYNNYGYICASSVDKTKNKIFSLNQITGQEGLKIVEGILSFLKAELGKDYIIFECYHGIHCVKKNAVYKTSIDIYNWHIDFKFNNNRHSVFSIGCDKHNIAKYIKILQAEPALNADLMSVAKASKEVLKKHEQEFISAKKSYERREKEYNDAKEFYDSLPDEIKLLAEI